MRMICPLTFAKEFLAVTLADSLKLDSFTQRVGPFSRISGYWPWFSCSEVSMGQTPLGRKL